MGGFGTDTTIDTYVVTLPNGDKVHVSAEFDGVNPEPCVTACVQEPDLWLRHVAVVHERKVLIDGIEEEDEHADD